LEFTHKYGLLGAGAVAGSLVGRMVAGGVRLGPVAALTYRVASRTVNVLRSGSAVPGVHDLGACGVILFHAPAAQKDALVAALGAGGISWPGRTLILCDCEMDAAGVRHFRRLGAGVASVRSYGMPGSVLLEGAGRGLSAAQQLARTAGLKSIELRAGNATLFKTGVMLSGAAMTPLIDTVASLFRAAGVHKSEAPRLAASLVALTAADYARSGRQSWAWHKRAPEARSLLAEVDAAPPALRQLLRAVLLFGLEVFDKHPDVAGAIRRSLVKSAAAPAQLR